MRSVQSLALVAITIGSLVGCSSDLGSDSASLSQSTEITLYPYFRSNSTGWNPADTNRMRATNDPVVFHLLVDVKESWMTGGGDPSIFTKTDQLNGWGTYQQSWGTSHGAFNVPGGDSLVDGGANFNVVYPELGRYRVTVDLSTPKISVTAATLAEQWTPCMNEDITTVAQSPSAQSTALVGCRNGDIFLTFNALSVKPNWTRVDVWNTSGGTFGLPNLPVNAIAYSPSDIKSAYVAFGGTESGHKLWKTVTGGHYWEEITSVPLGQIWSVSVNPLDYRQIYATGPGGVVMSTDGGNTWTPDVTPGPLAVPLDTGAKLSTVTMSPQNRDIVWVGATNGDIFFTANATSGQTWAKATHGMPSRMVTHVAVDATQSPPRVLATFDGLYNDSVWITTNNGFGWANLHTSHLPRSPIPLPGVNGLFGVSFNPADNSTLYINGTFGSGMSSSGGASWSWSHFFN